MGGAVVGLVHFIEADNPLFWNFLFPCALNAVGVEVTLGLQQRETEKPLEERAPNRTTRTLMCLAPWLVLGIIFFLAFSHGWASTWHALGVPASTTAFMDLRGFPSGREVARQGGDPLIANPLDPEKRPLNYPHLLAHLLWGLGISDKNIPVFGVLFGTFYLCCISWMIYASKAVREGWLLLIAGLSIAPLFGIEQGNTDLLIFSLVFLAFLLRNHFSGPLVFLTATLLKIYPIAAFGVDTVRRPAKGRTVSVLLMLVVMGVFAWRWRELDAIRHATPATFLNSYGILSLQKLIRFWVVDRGATFQQANDVGRAIAVSCWTSAVIVFVLAWIQKPNVESDLLRSRSGLLFATFAGIYLFSFFVGSNFDYRLIYLIPTLPFAAEMTLHTKHFRWGFVYIVFVLLAENLVVIEFSPGLILAQFTALIIFFMALPMFAKQLKCFVRNARSLE
jgi:hypothetical protein